jgi:hypothetical protein
MTPHDLGGYGFIFAILVTVATVVKYERRLSRWLLKSPRRRKRKAIQARLQKPALP